MNRILVLVLVFAALCFSQEAKPERTKKVRPPREHYGFYYSMGFGASYIDYSAEDVYDEDYYERSFEKVRVEAWSVPDLEFRFGRSFANLFAIYYAAGLTLFNGEGKYADVSYYRDDDDRPWSSSEVDEYLVDDDATGIQFYMGVGFIAYPFRNQNSVMNGFFFGFSSGPYGVLSFLHEEDRHGGVEVIGMASKFEIGKDWWVSDTWSLGFSLEYMFHDASFVDLDEAGLNKFGLKIRLTRG